MSSGQSKNAGHVTIDQPANEDTRNATAGQIKDIRDALFDAGNARSANCTLLRNQITNSCNQAQSYPSTSQGWNRKDCPEWHSWLVDVTQFQAQFEGFEQSICTRNYGVRALGSSTLSNFWWRKQNWGLNRACGLWSIWSIRCKGKWPSQIEILWHRGELQNKVNLLPDAFDFSSEKVGDFDISELGPVFPEGMEFVFPRTHPFLSSVVLKRKRPNRRRNYCSSDCHWMSCCWEEKSK